MYFSTILLAFVVFVGTALAHHEHLLPHEIERRAAVSRRCQAKVSDLNQVRRKRHLEGQTLPNMFKAQTPNPNASESNTSTVLIHTEAHHFSTIQNDTCVLMPEAVPGPYMYRPSQLIRQDMSEGQPGVPLYLDIGVIDINTCEPLPDALVDLWHCNATGSYSSFGEFDPDISVPEALARMNITVEELAGDVNIHTDEDTWLRGMWPTDKEGVTELKTIFPGFYFERSIHIHLRVHTNWVVRANGTVVSDKSIATGQIFFPEDVSAQIMALEPYASHTQTPRLSNDVDALFDLGTIGGFNPVVIVSPLDGVDFANGVIGYITLGVNTTFTSTDSRIGDQPLG